MSQQLVTLLLGSNLGNKEKNIETALKIINGEVGTILKRSEILNTEPLGFVSENFFCNIAVLIKTQFSPIKLLKSLKKIEEKMGRNKDSGALGGYTDRIIDVDIVLYGNILFFSCKLQIPHEKNLNQRDFSKKLLMELTKDKNNL